MELRAAHTKNTFPQPPPPKYVSGQQGGGHCSIDWSASLVESYTQQLLGLNNTTFFCYLTRTPWQGPSARQWCVCVRETLELLRLPTERRSP